MTDVSFLEIPNNLRTPLFYLELDNTQATEGPQTFPITALLIGQRLSTGSILALKPQRIQNKDQGKVMFGTGSQLANMIAAFFAANAETPLFAVAVDDPGGGAAAVFTVVFGGSPTASGAAVIYVEGHRFSVSVTATSTPAQLATALAAAINADVDLMATAGAVSATVTLTCRHLGVCGTDIDVRHSYLDGESLPPGLTVTIANPTPGTGDVALSAVWATLGDRRFNVLGEPAVDATNLTSLETELSSRNHAMRPIPMRAFTFKRGSLSTVSTLGNSRNHNRLTILPSNGSPQSPWESAAAVAGVRAVEMARDIALTMQSVAIPGLMPPSTTDRFTKTERNSLLYSGISTWFVDAGGVCRIEALITTYKTNAFGGSDPSYLYVEPGDGWDYIRWDLENLVTQELGRTKLGKDGGNYGAGQKVTTPGRVRAILAGRSRQYEELGLIEDSETLIKNMIVSRSTTNPDRLNVVMNPNAINNLRILAVRLAFLN